MNSFSTTVDIDKITSLPAIIHELEKLRVVLKENEMRQFTLFNDAYLVVTSGITRASKAGDFSNPKFIDQFSVCFARYYFKAINSTVQDSDIPYAWGTLNRANREKTPPNFIFLLLGANAHINHDLPLVLAQLMEQQDTDDLLLDVVKIDKILMKSGREIIASFSESNKLLDLLKRRVIFLYYRPVMYMILFWRIRAWRRFKSIKKNGFKDSNYEVGSVKIAKRFLLLSKVIGNEF